VLKPSRACVFRRYLRPTWVLVRRKRVCRGIAIKAKGRSLTSRPRLNGWNLMMIPLYYMTTENLLWSTLLLGFRFHSLLSLSRPLQILMHHVSLYNLSAFNSGC
jgi:hypothetical protein